MKFCPECGNKRIIDNSKYCSECGYNFIHNNNLFEVIEENTYEGKITTFWDGIEFPLENIPLFHRICKGLKVENNKHLKKYIIHEYPGVFNLNFNRDSRDITLSKNVLEQFTTRKDFLEFLYRYIIENVNDDGTIKTWEAGPDSDTNPIKKKNSNKNDILDLIETAIDLTSPRATAKRIVKNLRE